MSTHNNATYVDGFVLVVPKKKIGEYRKMAQGGAKMWKKYGALDYKECIGDDLTPNMGKRHAHPHVSSIGKTQERRDRVVFVHYVPVKSAPRPGE